MKECQLCKKCYTDEINTCPDDGMPTFHSLSGEPVLEGKYHLERRLGQGGMGVVYCAKHAYLKTQHAIKIILPDLVGNDPQLVTRFRQEALAAAAIRHHNVVQVTDYGVAQGTMPFLVMEYVEGESLHDLLAREGKLTPDRALELMAAICNGIGVAHKQGIVHRDLKPLNIMIMKDKSTMSEAVKILDFGLAKIKSGELLGSFIQAQTTGLMGSPYYMAPEQWADEDPDARSDIYSLAVMLFQMLTGDVPFKGSSIPAIMKKHLTDPPPSFAEVGVNLSPELEKAVRHALEKSPDKRTATVDEFVRELRDALGFTSMNIGLITSANMPVSSLQILTNPPQSNVFVDDVAVGASQTNGWLLLEGMQSGTHHLRVSHEGFQDWEGEVFCDGKPQQVVTRLEKDTEVAPAGKVGQDTPPQSFAATQGAPAEGLQETIPRNWQTDNHGREIISAPKNSFFSPLILVITGIAGLLLLLFLGVTGAYLSGLIGTKTGNTNVGNTATPTPAISPTTEASVKGEMAKITGGSFTMGRNEGAEILEKPEFKVDVDDFWMDKTEVTNAEYFDFVSATGYKPVPLNWEKGKPLASEMQMPVRYVNIEDIKAFANWRSKRDGFNYRLPTEEEWEYAARNGSEGNLYPWGDNWEEGRAVVNSNFNFAKVGSLPGGANKWGVQDLIGNVWEWTSSPASAYPGSEPDTSKEIEEKYQKSYLVVRGGFDPKKESITVTSTSRVFAPSKTRDKVIGFRLVRSGS